MIIQLSQKELVNILSKKIKEFGSTTSGTYDDRDPTHYEKSEADFYVGSAPVKTTEYPGEDYLPEILRAQCCDSTWGVEFEFTFVDAAGTERKSSGYFNCIADEWYRVTGEFERDFVNALTSESFVKRDGDGNEKTMKTNQLTEAQKNALELEEALNEENGKVEVETLSDSEFKMEMERAFATHELEHKILR